MAIKKSSDIIAVSFGVTESGANTYTEEQIALQLDVLNNEVFVVLAVDLNAAPPDAVQGVNTTTSGQMSSTTQAQIQSLGTTNVISLTERSIRSFAAPGDGGVSFTHMSGESPTATLNHIAIIATNNFFVALKGSGNLGAKTFSGRVWGYRAKADGSTYAALVQSEVLSA